MDHLGADIKTKSLLQSTVTSLTLEVFGLNDFIIFIVTFFFVIYWHYSTMAILITLPYGKESENL